MGPSEYKLLLNVTKNDCGRLALIQSLLGDYGVYTLRSGQSSGYSHRRSTRAGYASIVTLWRTDGLSPITKVQNYLTDAITLFSRPGRS